MSGEAVEVTIEEPVEKVEEKFDIEGLSPQEIKMAEDQGLIKEEKEEKKEEDDGELKEQSKPETEDNKVSEEVEETEEEKVEEVTPTFDEAEKDEKLTDKFNRNEKALFWKWKSDKHKRQEAQKELNELKTQLEDNKGDSGSKKKIAEINKLLNEDVDNLTIEALQKIINEAVEEKEEVVKPDVVAEKRQTRLNYTEKIGLSKYEKFNEYALLAKEMTDTSQLYNTAMADAIENENIDEGMLAEEIVNLARLHPKFQEISDSVDPEKKEIVEKAVKNSKKKVSSASLSGSSGRRTINENELTCDDAGRLSISQWSKLSDETRQRIKQGIDP